MEFNLFQFMSKIRGEGTGLPGKIIEAYSRPVAMSGIFESDSMDTDENEQRLEGLRE